MPHATSKRCVYTALIGQYERLNEQPMAALSDLPFICLTDDPTLTSDTWEIRLITPVFDMDPVRSQRQLKMLAHRHLADFDASLYIDNTVLLEEVPERIFDRHFPASGLGLPRHSDRESLLDEFHAVARLGLDDPHRIFEQLNHYSLAHPEALDERPYWTAILLRDHRNAQVQSAMELWAAHVLRYSRRDQLSFNVALRHAGLVPDALEIDNHASWFHTWPHMPARNRQGGMRAATRSLQPPIARIRELEQQLARQALGLDQRVAQKARRLKQVLSAPGARWLMALRTLAGGPGRTPPS